MNIPFKKEETNQLHSPIIEMRKNSGGYFWWIAGGVVLLVVIILLFQTRTG